MIEHKYNDNRYYFKKDIEHNGDYCGPCKYVLLGSCVFFGILTKDTFNGKLKRLKKCIDSQEI
jgi:hypothetical protein